MKQVRKIYNRAFTEKAVQLSYGNKLISKVQMKLEIFEYIEIWYNRKSRHSALNYATITLGL